MGTVTVGKINVDDSKEVASAIGVRGIPMLVLYKGGSQIASQVGSMTGEQLETWVKSYTQKN